MSSIFESYLNESKYGFSKNEIAELRNHPFNKKLKADLAKYGYKLASRRDFVYVGELPNGLTFKPEVAIEPENTSFMSKTPLVCQDTDAKWNGKNLSFFVSTKWMGPLKTESEINAYVEEIQKAAACVKMLNAIDWSKAPRYTNSES